MPLPTLSAPLLLLSLRVVTLAEAEKRADENQPQNVIADAQARLSRAQQDVARAPLLPQLSASATGGYRFQNAGFGAFGQSNAYYTGQLRLNQYLWDGSTADTYRAARLGAEAQAETARATRLASLQAVRTAFFNARAAKAMVEVSRESLANYERHLKQIEGFVKVGNRPEIDVAQARADLGNARATLLGAENDYATARAQLNQAMGVVEDTDYDVADDLLPALSGEDGALDALVDEAMAARPDVVALSRQIDAQQLTIAATRGGYFPSLGATASGNVQGNDPQNPVASLTLGLTANWDLYSGGRTIAQVEQARASLAILQAQLLALRLQVRLDVEQARLAVRAARATLAALEDALANARQRLRLAEGRYANGVGNIIELGDAQTAANGAAGQKIRAEFNVGVARAQLLRALARR